ncbi:hypothetical protein QR680_004500 [Steinernema hermaphroditum]|uniref:ShKT domain-containing protein n=1 Tax=Steinernema hermaphroditum TaxID=289476 RepID=A0AA39HR76_9BILA|nr:hypothetical protein QR680_004500 [Steinernema hermaphroditum]
MGRLLVLLVLISSVFGQYDDMPTLCDEFSPDMCPDGQTCDTEEGECVVAVPPGNGGNPPEGNSNPGGVVVGGDLNDPCTPGDANACRTDVPSPGLVCDAVRKKCVFAGTGRWIAKTDDFGQAVFCDLAHHWCQHFDLMCDRRCSFTSFAYERMRS